MRERILLRIDNERIDKIGGLKLFKLMMDNFRPLYTSFYTVIYTILDTYTRNIQKIYSKRTLHKLYFYRDIE